MRHAETVTFGGSGLDRAAEIRGDDWQSAPHTAVVFWRGKPLLDRDTQDLTRLTSDHPVLADSKSQPVLLGREEDGSLIAAYLLDGWDPSDFDAEQLWGFLDPSVQVHPEIDHAEFTELRGVMTRLSPRDAELAATGRAVFEWHRIHAFCANCGAASNIVQSGWQRTCSSCGRHHFPRTDPVVIMLIVRGNSVLVGRSPGWPDRMYSLLAGFVEPGETLEAAVRREVYEEAGIRVGEVGYLASQPWPFPASLMFGCIGYATSEDITVDPAELEDAIWMTREEVLEALAGRHEKVAAARKGAIAHFLLSNWVADTLE
ncbi:NAD(+) diphosphatase [Shimia ponticola]|uniref:NAD(+) diphosphatase n=1 Tax=Shimia ponticola TaxID=2582893 RepID=UPI0011BF33AB|nr:NAD(+) diphosphatase [Shimia ponticola]